MRRICQCSQHSFGLPLRMNGMHITQFDHERSITRNLITCVSTICHEKLTQSIALERKRFIFREMWFSLVCFILQSKVGLEVFFM